MIHLQFGMKSLFVGEEAADVLIDYAAHVAQQRGDDRVDGLIREYLPKGTDITDHQPYLNAMADELNDRPRQTLGFLTPRAVFNRALAEGPVALTT